MNNPAEIKRTAQQLILQPFYLENTVSNNARKITGSILAIFFAFLGVSILISGFKATENKMLYIAFGIILLAFPVLVFLLVKYIHQKMIKEVNRQGVVVNSNQLYKWETLKSISYHVTTSKYHTDDFNHAYIIDFHFSDGDARSSYTFSGFKDIEFIADQLQVVKNIKENAYHT